MGGERGEGGGGDGRRRRLGEGAVCVRVVLCLQISAFPTAVLRHRTTMLRRKVPARHRTETTSQH